MSDGLSSEIALDESSLRFLEGRCPRLIGGRAGSADGALQCEYLTGHKQPHRFMAPDATLRWWPVELGAPPSWEDAITTPATDPRWPAHAD